MYSNFDFGCSVSFASQFIGKSRSLPSDTEQSFQMTNRSNAKLGDRGSAHENYLCALCLMPIFSKGIGIEKGKNYIQIITLQQFQMMSEKGVQL